MVKYRDDHKRVLEGSESTTRADIVGFVMEKYPHLPKINLVYEDNVEKFVLDDDDFNIMMEESKDAAVIISVVDKESKPELLKERYGVYCVGLGIEVAAISPIAERCFEDSRKLRVFKSVFYSTGIVSPYAAACVLLPQKFAPYLVAVGSLICVVITLYNFRGILGLKWVCEKAVNGARWIRSWIRSTFTRDGQVKCYDKYVIFDCTEQGALLERHDDGVRGGWGKLFLLVHLCRCFQKTYLRMHFDALKAVQSGLETAAIVDG
ncbi:hypothetical protein Tco_1148187 [Tanacetum coccineum]